jgi:hypothetical protein
MPFLDARALEADPDGLSFLASVLAPDPERRAAQRCLVEACSAEPALNTTLELLLEAASEQAIWAASNA